MGGEGHVLVQVFLHAARPARPRTAPHRTAVAAFAPHDTPRHATPPLACVCRPPLCSVSWLRIA